MEKKKIHEIRMHGRGGQGTVTAANLFIQTAHKQGYAGVQSIPLIGAERRGSPIRVFARISQAPIKIHSQIYNPDIVLVLDPSLFVKYTPMVLDGLKENGTLILNTRKSPKEVKEMIKKDGLKICTVDATGISIELNLEVAGQSVVNAPMLGALAKGTGLIKLQNLIDTLRAKWKGKWGELNIKSVELAFDRLKCLEN
ncbi:MAG: 2-oxoacid:acceptor oxidoreductase family protein [Candidatus Helarchaeota archaeon]